MPPVEYLGGDENGGEGRRHDADKEAKRDVRAVDRRQRDTTRAPREKSCVAVTIVRAKTFRMALLIISFNAPSD